MKYALITGGSRGVGRAISIQLARDGYSVIINYKSNHEAAQETLAQIQKEGGQAELLPFDVSQPQAINEALESWQKAHPDEYIEALVHNAGVFYNDFFLDIEPNEWHNVIDTTLNGFYYVTQRILPAMFLCHYGRIVNISSMAALNGHKGAVGYSAAKAAIIGATRSLAVEVASRKITVNAVALGIIHTDLQQYYAAKCYRDEKEVQSTIRTTIPMQRLGEPEEVADLVSFLVSDRAAYITGQVIGINGGLGV